MKRRVFFSFHYDDVASFRANVVRNSDVVRAANIEETNFYDKSIWEEARIKGAGALKELIDNALLATSVSCVLIGSETYERQWVRYEIARSFARGNALIGIHINGVKDKAQTTKLQGNNPFEYLKYRVDDTTRTVYLYEWAYHGGQWQWRPYSRLLSFPKSQLRYPISGEAQLSQLAWIYDWVHDNGYRNLGTWAHNAALNRGR